MNLVIGATGAAVMLLSLGGLWEIGLRAGPYEEPIEPALVPLQVSGRYESSPAQGSGGPGGVCVGSPPGTSCQPAQVRLQLRVQGLPVLVEGQGSYVAFLADASQDAWRAGPLVFNGQAHVLDYQAQRDAGSRRFLVLTLEPTPDAGRPGPLLLHQRSVSHGAPVDLSHPVSVRLVPGQGHVRVAEIGAMSKSVVALGHLDAPPIEGWTYHAWLQPIGSSTSFVHLGAWDESVLDARLERLRLEDHARFLTTLEPASEDAPGGPGFPAFAADFPS